MAGQQNQIKEPDMKTRPLSVVDRTRGAARDRTLAAFGAAFLWLTVGVVLAQEPEYVGGRTIVLGEYIQVAVPEGWHRGTPSMEKEAGAFVLMYTGKNFDPKADEPHGIIQINPGIDEFEDGAYLGRYYENVEKNLSESGWTRGDLTIGGNIQACYSLESADSTTFCIQLPFHLRSLTAYVIVPKRGAGFPKYALRLLQAISLR
jgi:hypothetical protein